MATIPPVAILCGARVRARRQQLGLTQKAVSMQAGLSFQYLSNIEKGEVNPPIGTLARIAHALGIRLIALIDDEGQITNGRAELVPLLLNWVTTGRTVYDLLSTAQQIVRGTVEEMEEISR